MTGVGLSQIFLIFQNGLDRLLKVEKFEPALHGSLPAADYNTQPFIYKALDPFRSEIRLLKLQPGVGDAHLHCSLVHTFLEGKPCYEALSYAWGDAKDRRDIFMDGHIFSITASLATALRHLRRSDEVRTLWVDALCINQEDLGERAQQVQKMRNIFWSSQRVLAWTGEPNEDIDEVLEMLQMLSEPSIFMRSFELAAKRGMVLRRINYDWEKFELLFKFLNRPYWSRTWVVQELAMPGLGIRNDGLGGDDKVLLGCGSRWLPFSKFLVACATLFQLMPGITSSDACLTSAEPSSRGRPAALGMIITVRSCIPTASRQRLSIGNLLRMTYFLNATDPRDRVYALLALAREKDRALVPNYSISNGEMLRRLAQHLILTDDNLAVLSGNRLPPQMVTDEYSSWTLDPRRLIKRSTIDWEPETTPFRVSASKPLAVTFSNDLRFLTIKGRIIDKIDKVIGPFDFDKFPGLPSEIVSPTNFTKHLEELEQYGSCLSPSKREIFWRTLVLDVELRGSVSQVRPAPAMIGKWFDVIVNSSSERPDTVAEALMLFYAQTAITNQCFYATATGQNGLGPYGTMPGDIVTLLYGGKFCYILREVGDHYIFVGDAYLHGVMYGELLGLGMQKEWEKLEEKDFVLW
ncbi:HET-domain-containing protein [Acephala macrosclerotiorum]|nr:HET-domain-containing protein [Acephala macrosclerotiorum]